MLPLFGAVGAEGASGGSVLAVGCCDLLAVGAGVVGVVDSAVAWRVLTRCRVVGPDRAAAGRPGRRRRARNGRRGSRARVE